MTNGSYPPRKYLHVVIGHYNSYGELKITKPMLFHLFLVNKYKYFIYNDQA